MKTSNNLKSTVMIKSSAYVSIILVVLLSLFIFIYKVLYNAEQLGMNYAQIYNNSIENIIDQHALVLKSGAASLSYFMTKNHSEKDIELWMNNYIKYIEKTLGTKGLDVFGIINGKLVSGQGRLGSVTMPVSKMKWYTSAVKQKGEVVHTDVYTDIVNGEKVFTLATVLDNGKDILALDVFPKQIGSMWLLNNELPLNTSYFLTDNNGEIIFLKSSIIQPLSNFQKAVTKAVNNIYSGNNEYNSSFHYIIDLEGKKRSVFYSFTQNDMIVILTIPQLTLYKQSLNIIKNDIFTFFSNYTEFVIFAFIIFITISLRMYNLNKVVKYQNQSIKALSNSYAAIYRINLKTRKYINIKKSEFAYIQIQSKGDYSCLLKSISSVMDKDTKNEFNKQFSIENMIKLSRQLVNEFGGDFKWEVNGESCWMNVTVLFDTYNIANDAVMCFRNVNVERIKQLESMQLLEDNMHNMQNNIQTDKMFYSNISHDMRTPINNIMGLIELLRYNIDNKDKILEYANKIQVTSSLLKELVDDILIESKDSKGIKDDEVLSFNLKDDIENLVEIFKIQAKTENKNFDLDFHIKDVYVKGDFHKLCHILNNLLSNAFKYTNENDSISLKIMQIQEKPEILYKFVIKDTGIGMSKSFLEKLFKPFAREHMFTDKKVQGIGLGMAIVLKRVDEMDGSINVESSLGQGTTITVILPFDKSSDNNKSVYGQINNNECDEDFLAGKNILIVEDNKVNMEILNELLKIKNINVLQAWNGIDAVEIVKKSKEYEIDAVLMDMILPEMDGCQAAKEIRNMQRKDISSLPIIALTANAFAEDVAKTEEAGMNAHIVKPINYNILFTTLCQLMKARKTDDTADV